MKKILFFTFFLVLGWVMAPTQGFSALIYYDAYGSISDKYDNPLQISGGMYIENQLRTWMTGEPVDYTADIPGYEFGQRAYGLTIEFFNFKVGEYDFFGSGDFYMVYSRECPSSDAIFNYSEWWLEGSQGSQWNFWGNPAVSNVNPIYINDKISLADEINFEEQLQAWDRNCWILGDPYLGEPYGGSLNLTLVRQDPVPVPEPSTAILFGIGIAGLFIYSLRGSASST